RKWMVPATGSTSRITVCAVVVFPHPDSPTSASISPAARENEMPSTAWATSFGRRAMAPMTPRWIGYWVTRSSTSRRSGGDPGELTGPARRSNQGSRGRPDRGVVEVAPRVVSRFGGQPPRRHRGARTERDVAARREGASDDLSVEAWRRSGDRDHVALAVEIGRRGEEESSVGMQWAVIERLHGPRLDDLPRVHHCRP